jgi:hypothetical protein
VIAPLRVRIFSLKALQSRADGPIVCGSDCRTHFGLGKFLLETSLLFDRSILMCLNLSPNQRVFGTR